MVQESALILFLVGRVAKSRSPTYFCPFIFSFLLGICDLSRRGWWKNAIFCRRREIVVGACTVILMMVRTSTERVSSTDLICCESGGLVLTMRPCVLRHVLEESVLPAHEGDKLIVQIWPEQPFPLLLHLDRIEKRRLQTVLLPVDRQ